MGLLNYVITTSTQGAISSTPVNRDSRGLKFSWCSFTTTTKIRLTQNQQYIAPTMAAAATAVKLSPSPPPRHCHYHRHIAATSAVMLPQPPTCHHCCCAARRCSAEALPCYILEEIEWTGIVGVGLPLVCGWLGKGLDHSNDRKLVLWA